MNILFFLTPKSDVFDNVNVTKDGNIITFSAEQKELLSSDTNYSLLYDDITVNITIPFEVISNNADKVNGNTYTWNIKKDSDYKTIEFSYKECEPGSSPSFKGQTNKSGTKPATFL